MPFSVEKAEMLRLLIQESTPSLLTDYSVQRQTELLVQSGNFGEQLGLHQTRSFYLLSLLSLLTDGDLTPLQEQSVLCQFMAAPDEFMSSYFDQFMIEFQRDSVEDSDS